MPNPTEKLVGHFGKIVMSEDTSQWILKGSFDVMKPLIPKLKSQKVWYYWGTDRSWRAYKANITPRQLENVRKLFGNETEAPNTAVSFDDFVETVKTIVLAATSIVVKSPDMVAIRTALIPFNALAGDVGGKYSAVEGWLFSREHTKTPQALEMLGVLGAASAKYERNLNALGELLEIKAPIRLHISQGVVYLKGNTYPYRERIKAAGFRFEIQVWQNYITKVNVEAVRKLITDLNQIVSSTPTVTAPVAPKPEEPKKAPAPRTNSRAGNCEHCRGPVAVGEGFIRQVLDDDEKMIWVVRHQTSAACDAWRAKCREKNETVRIRNQAVRSLREICMKPANYVEGQNLTPEGEVRYIDQNTMYGGGCWVVIEPEQEHFWYVQNNGHDGDDWSRNNVQTGGAGAMGYRLKLTPEILGYIEVATS